MLNPHMEPFGPIFRLHRKPRDGFGGTLVQSSHLYWAEFLRETLGERVVSITNLPAILPYLDRNQDSDFERNDPISSFPKAVEARKAFAKLRGSQAGWYAWAAQHTTSSAERKEMTEAAELAFLQALILCPREELGASPIFKGYSRFLRNQGREGDARSIELIYSGSEADAN